MTSLKDGDLQHSSALAQSPKGDIEPNHPSEINPNSDIQGYIFVNIAFELTEIFKMAYDHHLGLLFC